MSIITDVGCVLSQKAFDAFCEKFHIPEEVHPIRPDQGNTMHERPAGKIGLYTRLFDFANFRLPLSTFLVDILMYFHINISQLSVIGAAKNDHFFWVDDFACPVHFSWHTAKNVTRDPAPVAADFNVQDYATLVAHPSPFWKFLEKFLCLVGLSRHYTLDEETYPLFLDKDGEDMDIFAFIHTSDPTKVKAVERERKEDEPRLLETIIGRIVPLLPVAPDRGQRELDASVDKLFDEGGSGAQTKQGDSASGGGEQGMNIQPVTETTDVVVEDVIPLQPRRLKKRKTIFAHAGGPSHPPKILRENHKTPSGVSVGEPIPTMPFVTSCVSATPKREGEGHTDSVDVDSFTRPSFPVLTATTTITSTADPAVVVKEKIVEPSLFAAESTFTGRTDTTMASLTDLTASDFLWNVTNGSRHHVDGVFLEMVDEFAPSKFFASVRGMKHDQLFTEFNGRAARQMSLSAKVDEEVRNLKAQLLLKEAEATEAILLCAETSKLETAKKSIRDEVNALNERNTILEKERNALDVMVTDLEAIDVSKERELTDSTAQVTSIKSQNDNIADQ
nr:putative transposase (putative), gypsy type [Tanacetum cinerariifolium]